MNNLQNLEEPDEEKLKKKMVDLPFTKPGIKKLIIFDLDETLVHRVKNEDAKRKQDVFVNIRLPSGNIAPTGFNIRPYTIECLELANKFYEVVCFTASSKFYADAILDHIDPEKKYI